jgi:hypothetical protein
MGARLALLALIAAAGSLQLARAQSCPLGPPCAFKCGATCGSAAKDLNATALATTSAKVGGAPPLCGLRSRHSARPAPVAARAAAASASSELRVRPLLPAPAHPSASRRTSRRTSHWADIMTRAFTITRASHYDQSHFYDQSILITKRKANNCHINCKRTPPTGGANEGGDRPSARRGAGAGARDSGDP